MKHFYFYLTHFFLTSLYHKTNKSLLILLLLIPLVSQGQFRLRWAGVAGQPAVNVSVAVGNDQNPVFFSVDAANTGYNDPHLLKMDGNGGTIWQLQLPDGGFTHRLDIQGNSYVLGTNAITKVNTSGQTIWAHDLTQYNMQPETFELDDFGSAYIAGFTGNAEIGVLKISNTSEKVWLQKLAFNNTKKNTQNLVLALGNAVYVGGTELGEKDVQQATFFKLNELNGAEVFKRTIANNAEMINRFTLKGMLWHDSGNLNVFVDEGALTHGHTSQLITKYDTDGNIIWRENFLFEARDYYTDATLDVDGNILLLTTEQLKSGRGSDTGFGISKISPDGEKIWHHTYSGSVGRGVALLSNGNIAVISTQVDINQQPELLLQLFDPAGNQITESIYRPDAELVNATDVDIAPDALGNLYTAVGYGDNLLTIKYTASNSCTKPNVIVKSDVIDCMTNTAQLQAATNATGASFNWTGPEGYTSNEQNPVVTAPGDYTLTITTGTNCAANATVTVLPANTTNACYTIDFENETTGLISLTQTKGGTVAITGLNRQGNGFAPENHAAIFESGMPTGDDDDLHADWGKVLIINETLHGEPNDNRKGGILLLDFSTFGPITMESLKVLDIDTYEDDSWVVLYDSNETELFRTQLQPLGDNSKQTADLGNTPNVMRVRVLLGGTEGEVGSGAIDDIKFCIDNEACEETTATAYAAPTLFTDKTIILYKPTLTETYEVNLYDLQGNLVRQLAKGNATAGELQQIQVQAGNLKNGLYIARIVSESGSQSVKLIVSR